MALLLQRTILLVCVVLPATLYGQICENDYLKADSLLWANYEKNGAAIYAKMDANPGVRDSLERLSEKLYKDVFEENARLALKYAATPTGLQRVYMVRGEVQKQRLDSALSALPDSMKANRYAAYLRDYIAQHQIEIGDSIIKFSCQLPEGTQFDWKLPQGRRLLLVYDGLTCMGKSGREILGKIAENPDSFNVVPLIYVHAKDGEELCSIREEYGLPVVSDFQIEGSVMNNVYGAQAQPTCYLFDEKECLKSIFLGVDGDIWSHIE